MKDKFLLSLIGATCLIFFLAVGAVIVVSMKMAPEVTSGQLSDARSQQDVAHPVSVVEANVSGTHAAPSAASLVQAVGVVPASSSDAVSDSDLHDLAAAVHLVNAKIPAPDKDAWAAQLPAAEKLSKKMCDCEQRNWLNRFILTANAAISGSDQYYQSAQILNSLSHDVLGLDAGVVTN